MGRRPPAKECVPMETLNIHGVSGDSRILIGESLANLSAYLPSKPAVIITDATVRKLYGHLFPPLAVIEIGSGEEIKTIDTVCRIYTALMEQGLDRTGFVVGIGGGIVCDIAGFVASTYMRGIDFGFAATTLLAQVDASVGGKNGVNFGGFKNMVGVFNQPRFVICDPHLLSSLPRRELCCGFAEIIKHALISNADMFAFIEHNSGRALALARDVIERLVHESVALKAGIVSRDEKEAGERRKLNFGHTFGHAIEAVSGIPHGEAVSAGMVIAARLSAARGMLPDADLQRICRLLAAMDLPRHVPVTVDALVDALQKDKKRARDRIHVILLDAIGRAVVQTFDMRELVKAVTEVYI